MAVYKFMRGINKIADMKLFPITEVPKIRYFQFKMRRQDPRKDFLSSKGCLELGMQLSEGMVEGETNNIEVFT